MLDDRPELDQRRNIDGPGYPPSVRDDTSFAVPALIIAAMLIIGGYFVVTYNGDVRTASNNTPVVERTAPTPAPAAPPVAPAPKQ